MSTDHIDPGDETSLGEATVVTSVIPGEELDGIDFQLQYFEKIRNHRLNYDKYQIRDKIAEGSMGSIHQVFDKNLKRSSVLKMILPRIQEDPRLFQQFIKEAQITARLEHPNIIPVHDIDVIDGNKLHFVMKQVRGDSLAKVLREIKEGTEDYVRQYTNYELLVVLRKVCDAVAFAHSLGILHRDIKPDNIMVGEFGEVLLMDWGLAKLLNEDDAPLTEGTDHSFGENFDSAQTVNGVVKGAPAFMSPEQAKGQIDKIDERSDIFLLGSTLYAVATLHAPYTGGDMAETLVNAQRGNLISAELRYPERTQQRDLYRIIKKAMAYDPANRYQNVTSMIEDIDLLLEGNTASETRIYEAGDLIMREGDIGEEAYVIISGKVEVHKSGVKGEVRLDTLGKGNVIGEMALISNNVRSATIHAIDKTELAIITKEVMEQGLSQLPSWLSNVVNCLTERLLNVNQQVHPLIAGDPSYHVLRQLQYCYYFLGKEKEDNVGNEPILTANLQEVIGEISTSLCISAGLVENMVSRLLMHGLLRPFGADEFSIANFELLDRLTQQAGKDQSINAASTSPVTKDLDRIQSYPVHQILGCKADVEVEGKLAKILSELRHCAAP